MDLSRLIPGASQTLDQDIWEYCKYVVQINKYKRLYVCLLFVVVVVDAGHGQLIGLASTPKSR